jgi:hypothetical protein
MESAKHTTRSAASLRLRNQVQSARKYTIRSQPKKQSSVLSLSAPIYEDATLADLIPCPTDYEQLP